MGLDEQARTCETNKPEAVRQANPKLLISDTVVKADLCKCSHVGYVHSRIEPYACAISSLKTGDCLCKGFTLTDDVTITISREDAEALINFLLEDGITIEHDIVSRLIEQLKDSL